MEDIQKHMNESEPIRNRNRWFSKSVQNRFLQEKEKKQSLLLNQKLLHCHCLTVAVSLRVVAIVMETESVYCRQNKGKQDQKEAAAAKTKKTKEEEEEEMKAFARKTLEAAADEQERRNKAAAAAEEEEKKTKTKAARHCRSQFRMPEAKPSSSSNRRRGWNLRTLLLACHCTLERSPKPYTHPKP